MSKNKATKLEVGKTYLCDHSRKGLFVMKVDDVGKEFAAGEIVTGKTHALLPENVKGSGERIAVRIEFAKWKEMRDDI